MGNWFFYDKWGGKYGPFTDKELKFKVFQNKITADTLLESVESGQKGIASQIPGLIPGKHSTAPMGSPDLFSSTSSVNTDVSPDSSVYLVQNTAPVLPSEMDVNIIQEPKFCIHCGRQVMENNLYCSDCERGSKTGQNFCRNCGVPLKPGQLICFKCGTCIKKE